MKNQTTEMRESDEGPGAHDVTEIHRPRRQCSDKWFDELQRIVAEQERNQKPVQQEW